MKLNTFFNHWLAIMLIAFCYAMTSSAQTPIEITSQEQMEEVLQDSVAISIHEKGSSSYELLENSNTSYIYSYYNGRNDFQGWTLLPTGDGYFYLVNMSTSHYWTREYIRLNNS